MQKDSNKQQMINVNVYWFIICSIFSCPKKNEMQVIRLNIISEYSILVSLERSVIFLNRDAGISLFSTEYKICSSIPRSISISSSSSIFFCS